MSNWLFFFFDWCELSLLCVFIINERRNRCSFWYTCYQTMCHISLYINCVWGKKVYKYILAKEFIIHHSILPFLFHNSANRYRQQSSKSISFNFIFNYANLHWIKKIPLKITKQNIQKYIHMLKYKLTDMANLN